MEARFHLEGLLDVGDQFLAVAGDGEVRHRIVVRRFGEGVPVRGVVACTDGNSALDEVGAAVGVKEQFHHAGDFGVDHRERVPPRFVERAAEPFPRLFFIVFVNRHVGVAGGDLDCGSGLPVVILGGDHEVGKGGDCCRNRDKNRTKNDLEYF
mgnify:CR=1 FL=1